MIEDFLANIKQHGLARQPLFKVDITFPNQIRNTLTQDFFQFYGINTNDARRLSLFCESAELPGKEMHTNPVKQHGPAIKLPYNVQYNDIPMVFYIAEDMKEKKFFDAWQSMIVDPNTGDLNYFDEYTSIITITQLRNDEQASYSTVLKKAWPVTVSPMPVTMNGDNTVHRVNVLFAYQKWEYMPTNSLESTQGVKELPINAGPISSKLLSQLEPLARSGLGGLTNRFNGVQGVQGLFSLFK